MSGKLPVEAQETADILLFFDKLFDSVNGNFDKIKGGKIYRSAVTPTSPHHKLWTQSLAVLRTMSYIDQDNRKKTVPSIKSWIRSVEGFQKIFRYMHALGVQSLLMRHFNQDPLENFFGSIRALGPKCIT